MLHDNGPGDLPIWLGQRATETRALEQTAFSTEISQGRHRVGKITEKERSRRAIGRPIMSRTSLSAGPRGSIARSRNLQHRCSRTRVAPRVPPKIRNGEQRSCSLAWPADWPRSERIEVTIGTRLLCDLSRSCPACPSARSRPVTKSVWASRYTRG